MSIALFIGLLLYGLGQKPVHRRKDWNQGDFIIILAGAALIATVLS